MINKKKKIAPTISKKLESSTGLRLGKLWGGH
jgi:hypothetical protein